MSCKNCGCHEVDYSESTGETVCIQCGSLVAEGQLVESLAFGESGSGQKHMLGTTVNAEKGFGGGNAASREISLQRGYNALSNIAENLRLPNNVIEAAYRLYTMALQIRFTYGRRVLHVAAACLYVICRKDKLPYMLLDFCDALGVPVRTLCRVFVKLVRSLRYSVPIIDPSIFLDRFAHQMDLGELTPKISQAAVRIVQSMDRNWLSAGRRPTGLCAASLLIAARFYDVKIAPEEIVSVLRISAPTISKRVTEFKKTSAAQIAVEDFEKTDLMRLPIINNPPAFEKQQEKIRMQLMADGGKTPRLSLMAEMMNCDENETEEIDETESSLLMVTSEEDALQTKLKVPVNYDSLVRVKCPPIDLDDLSQECESGEQVEQLALQVKQRLGENIDQVISKGQDFQDTCSTRATSTFESASSQPEEQYLAVQRSEERVFDSQETIADFGLPQDEEEDPLNSLFSMNLEKKDKKKRKLVPKKGREEPEDTEPIFTDDDEIDQCLLNVHERRVKQKIWDNMTKDIIGDIRVRDKANRKKQAFQKPIRKKDPANLPMLPPVSTLEESVSMSLDVAGTSMSILDGLLPEIEDSISSLFAL